MMIGFLYEVKKICEKLHAPMPLVKSTSKKALSAISETAKAILQYDPSNKQHPYTILLDENVKITPDLMFAVAHELRHEYQIENGLFAFCDYKEPDNNNGLSADEYNMQPEEIDANAFAYNYMLENYGIKMLFLPLSAEVKEAIYKRAEEIKE